MGWFHGIYFIVHVIVSIIIGSFFLYKSKELDISLLKYAGLYIIIGSFGTLPIFIEFPFIIITGTNIITEYGWLGVLNFMWFPIAFVLQLNIGTELLIPNKKWYIIITFSILGIIFEIFIIFNIMDCLNFMYPPNLGDYFVLSTVSGVPYIIRRVLLISLLVFNGIGLLIKSFQFKGILKKKFLTMSFIYTYTPLIFFLPIPLDIWINLTIISQMFIFYLTYYGLTPQKIKKPKKKKKISEKEVKLVSYLSGKPDITSEKKDFPKDRKKDILVFLSYATKDADMFRIKEISERLKNYEDVFNVLYWEEHLDDNFIKYMNENLGKCDVLVLFCSKNALNSIPVEKEWTAADALNKPIIPVYMDTRDIPPLLSSRIGMEYDNNNIENNVTKLHSLILRKYK